MTILVTGSSGHLGDALVRTLRGQGQEVRGIDVLPSSTTSIVASITDRGAVRGAMHGVHAVIHTATLHKPHVTTHSNEQFVDVNVRGTLTLLEEAKHHGVEAFVFTSTTSAFGSALSAAAGEPARWITEDVTPVAKNIYGATKTAAEGLCELFAHAEKLPTLVLRTSRFFPEEDDNVATAADYVTANAQANELLYRRVDVADIVDACLLAIARAPDLGFGRYIISASTPFTHEDLPELGRDAWAVVQRLFPRARELYAEAGWRMFPVFDRVYVNTRAREALGWRPRYDFAHVLACLAGGRDFRSPLAAAIGRKGYHRA